MSRASSSKPSVPDQFADVASVEELSEAILKHSINSDKSHSNAVYIGALEAVEESLGRQPASGLVRFACQTKLLRTLIDRASRQSDATSAARGLSAAAGLLRAQPTTLRVDCLRDELADALADAAARLLVGDSSVRAPNSSVRLALTDLTLAVLGESAKLGQCLELAHCLAFDCVLVQAPAKPPPTAATNAVLTAMAIRSGATPPAPVEIGLQPQVGKPASVCYADLVGRASSVYANDSDGSLELGRHSLAWPLRAGQRLPAGVGQSATLALLNSRHSAAELMANDIAPHLMSLINRRGGHLLIGVSPVSASIEGILVRLEDRDRLILGLQRLLFSADPVPDPGRVSVRFHPVTGRVLAEERRRGQPLVVQVSVKPGRPLCFHAYQKAVFTRDNRGSLRQLHGVNEILAANARQLALRSAAAHEARRLRAEGRRLRAQLEDFGCVFLQPNGGGDAAAKCGKN